MFSRDAANLLYGNSFNGLYVNIITSAVLAFGFPFQSEDRFKLYWWILFELLLLVRLGDILWWKYVIRRTNFSGDKAIFRFGAGAICTAIGWSVYAIYIFGGAETEELAATVIIICSMAGGAISVLAASRVISIVYTIALLVPLSVAAMMSGVPYLQILGVLGIVFSIVMTSISARSGRFIENAIHLKNNNAQLLDQMANEKKVISRINHELITAYQELNAINAELETRVQSRTEEIHQLANLDPLTGLFNRTAFDTHLTQTLTLSSGRGDSLALLFIDLDGFKKINDSFGHKLGDEILIQTARRLEHFADSNTHLCRWGGDEFLLLISRISEEKALEEARNLIAVLSKPIATQFELINIGASVGISMFPRHSESGQDLIQLADIAMYSQKKTLQPEPVVFDEAMLIDLKRLQKIRDGLDKAIELEQFHLVFQPIINTRTQSISSCEALLRWQFEDELIPPDEFIPIAERYGHIRKIGRWVIQAACQEAARWKDQHLAVSVNVSVLQMMEDDLEEAISQALNESGLAPNRLHLELTETVFSEDIPTIKRRIKRLQSLGLKIYIDDFGTGYSSLSQLQSLAVDVVKIDRAFIHNLNGNGKTIIQAALLIAKALNYSVIAEGVETQEQAMNLISMGVSYFQGYHFAHPMDSEALSYWMQAHEGAGS